MQMPNNLRHLGAIRSNESRPPAIEDTQLLDRNYVRCMIVTGVSTRIKNRRVLEGFRTETVGKKWQGRHFWTRTR